jgi:hypothetical protein
MTIAVITPPPLKPSEPGLSGAAAAQRLAGMGADARWIDASIGWHRFVLQPGRLAKNLEACAGTISKAAQRTFRRAIAAAGTEPPALRRASTYADRDVYTSAVNDLENALALAALPWPGYRLGVAMVALEEPIRRLESSATLEWTASRAGPFDPYFEEELIPELEKGGYGTVAVSLTFQQQAPAALRLAQLLAQRMPGARRVLGGPLVACWLAAGFDLGRSPFTLYDEVVAGTDEELQRLAAEGGVDRAFVRSGCPTTTTSTTTSTRGPLTVPLQDARWEGYLTPRPTVPMALGRGCAWRRCTFCPDHLHPRHEGGGAEEIAAALREVAAKFPEGAMLHLTDSAVPVEGLALVAKVIREERLPLTWHGFVRVEEELADGGFVRELAEGGCAMLQLGVESGAERILELLGKGAGPERSRRVLRATAAAGIRNQVYLLFGVPTETDAEREATRELVAAEAESIHAVNPALLNLPKGSPMHRHPERFGITELVPFGRETDLSLYDDFRCGPSLPRREARRWLASRFFKDAAVKGIAGRLRAPFKANHLCFL